MASRYAKEGRYWKKSVLCEKKNGQGETEGEEEGERKRDRGRAVIPSDS